MSETLAWIICSIIFGIIFIIETCFFVNKIIRCRNIDHMGVRTISVTSCEARFCMGWIWKFALDRTNNQMKLSLFILWYIVTVCLSLFITILLFTVIYYQT
jgi:hypothetical protein